MQLSTIETWKPIPGYEGIYEVSDHGNVRSLDRLGADGRRLKGKPMKQSLKDRYPFVTLCRNAKYKTFFVSRLVWQVFRGNLIEGMHIDHIDNNPMNNNRENLQQLTPKENVSRQKLFGNHVTDRVARGDTWAQRKTHCPYGHPLEGGNIMPSTAKLGRRGCLACNRAQSYVRWHPNLKPQLQELSDSYFQKIIS